MSEPDYFKVFILSNTSLLIGQHGLRFGQTLKHQVFLLWFCRDAKNTLGSLYSFFFGGIPSPLKGYTCFDSRQNTTILLWPEDSAILCKLIARFSLEPITVYGFATGTAPYSIAVMFSRTHRSHPASVPPLETWQL